MVSSTTVLGLTTFAAADAPMDLPTHVSTGIAQRVENLLTGAAAPAGSLTIDFNSGSNRTLTIQNGGIGTAGLIVDENITTTAGAFVAGATPASAGAVRLPNAQNISWRNGTNNGDVSITVNSSNQVSLTNPLLVTVGNNTGLSLRSGASGAFARLYIGRIADEFQFGLVSANDQFFTGSVAGDMCLKLDAGGTSILHLGNGTGTAEVQIADNLVALSSSTDLRFNKALVAMGGGAAPTFGTIGGSGPAAAGQNSWLRLVDSTGAAFWVPVWK